MLGNSWPWSKFKRWEFACKCGCGYDTVDAELMNVLLDVKREFRGATVIVNSGCRCDSYNMWIGGAKDSQHKKGRAADIVVVGVDPIEVYAYLCQKYVGKFGIGCYSGWVHIDTRSGLPWRK